MKIMDYFRRDKKLLVKVITGIIFLVVAFSFYLLKEGTEDEGMAVISGENIGSSESLTQEEARDIAPEEIVILVDVAGAVAHPAVVKLPEGSRVFEAVEKAGGFAAEADTRSLNQAEILIDGQKLYIPTKQEVEESLAGNPSPKEAYQSVYGNSQQGSGQSGLININTADSAELQQLSGVGPATAEKIINYRNENGKFKTIEDLKNVSGIGDKTFEKFRNKITV